MRFTFAPDLTEADDLVLKNLVQDVDVQSRFQEQLDNGSELNNDEHTDKRTEQQLLKLKEEPTVFTTWDLKDISGDVRKFFVQPYITCAQGIVRNPTDVVFLTHILLYLSTSLTSAILLYCRFSWLHALFHGAMQLWYCGSFTLMLHNHIHNGGLLATKYAWFDNLWPYFLEPLMGHTWHSYYYHHVKHHHVEKNGPDDLSSTVRYQRDELVDFLIYITRFMLLIWLELPLYFFRKKRPLYGAKVAFWELSNYLFIALMAKYNFHASLFVLVIPLIQMRIGLMIGNWGQHALIDEVEPTSDLRSSITLIDVPSNRYCFNDGYHTSHHLNPRRHWRDHPQAFLKAKVEYAAGSALVFHNIDYLMMTITLLRKDYAKLARCLVPMGEQIGMSEGQLAEMLRGKTRRFGEEELRVKFGGKDSRKAEEKGERPAIGSGVEKRGM